jgi:hypothetical protein
LMKRWLTRRTNSGGKVEVQLVNSMVWSRAELARYIGTEGAQDVQLDWLQHRLFDNMEHTTGDGKVDVWFHETHLTLRGYEWLEVYWVGSYPTARVLFIGDVMTMARGGIRMPEVWVD